MKPSLTSSSTSGAAELQHVVAVATLEFLAVEVDELKAKAEVARHLLARGQPMATQNGSLPDSTSST